MNRKNFPIVLMLIAGGIVSVISFIRGYEAQQKLLMLLITLIVFYGMGCLLIYTMNGFDASNEKKRLEAEKAAENRETAEPDKVAENKK